MIITMNMNMNINMNMTLIMSINKNMTMIMTMIMAMIMTMIMPLEGSWSSLTGLARSMGSCRRVKVTEKMMNNLIWSFAAPSGHIEDHDGKKIFKFLSDPSPPIALPC